MDLNYVAGNNQALVDSLEEYGCDLDSLLYVAKDFFLLCDELRLTPRQTADIFVKLKNTNDTALGKPLCPEVVVYENNRSNPTRLCVENKSNAKNFYFKAISGQSKADKKVIIYKCETCTDDVCVKRNEVRDHVLDKHLN